MFCGHNELLTNGRLSHTQNAAMGDAIPPRRGGIYMPSLQSTVSHTVKDLPLKTRAVLSNGDVRGLRPHGGRQ